MTTYPIQYRCEEEMPPHVVALVRRLMPHLLSEPGPECDTLRAQYRHARLADLTWTGAGFYVGFELPDDMPLMEYRGGSEGGGAQIDVEGHPDGAGCVLFVGAGRLDALEVFTYGFETWPPEAAILGVHHVIPFSLESLPPVARPAAPRPLPVAQPSARIPSRSERWWPGIAAGLTLAITILLLEC